MASIRIQADTKEAAASLKSLQTSIETLQKSASQVKIEIKTDGIEKFDKETRQSLNSLARLKKAEADLAKAQANLQRSADQVTISNNKVTESANKRITSENNVTKSYNERIKSENQVQAAAERRIKSENDLNREIEKGNNIEKKAATAVKETGDEIDKADKKMQGFISTFVKSAVIYQAIYAIRGAFMDALDTMKEVDSQLVTVRKVTQASVGEINQLREKAYATASKYGVGAADYLESVAEFARAGYKGQSDALAELSTKTQIVGDTTAEVANQFLLSMDAAYKYEGSVEKLTRVLDGANEIDNNYATSIQKIAEGLGLIAPIASQVHVSEQELSSAIGTITAVTQRSGTEAARALRALFLNIIGDTTTEIEDGVTATEESVSSLRTLLKEYAPDAVAAAEATGQIIDPMEAIGALAQAMDDGLLNEQQLMERLSDLGGKLRTSQLTALVSNWDMYKDMMGTYADSVGSADREVENALDSWERKTAILANTWTEFIQGSLDTNFIKGFLDGLTQVIKLLGNLGTALVAVGGAFVAIKLPQLAKSFGDLKTKVADFGKSLGSSVGGIQRAQLAIAGITAAITVATMAYNAHREAVEKDINASVDAANNDRTEIENIVKLHSQYEQAKSAYEDGTGSKEAYKTATEELVNALGEEAKAMGVTEEALDSLTQKEIEEGRASAELALQKIVNDIDPSKMGFLDALVGGAQGGMSLTMNQLNGQGSSIEQLQNLIKQFPELNLAAGQSAEEFAKNVVDAYDKAEQAQKELAEQTRNSAEMTDEQKDRWNAAQMILDRFSGNIDQLRGQLDNLDYYDNLDLDEAFNEAADAADNAGESAKIAASAYRDIASAADDAQAAINEFAEATKTEVNDAFKSYADIYAKFLEDWEAGLTGTNRVKAAIDALLPEEAINELRAKGVDVGELLYNDFYKGIFSAKGDDYGANLAWMLWDNDTIGEIEEGAKVIKNSVGDVIATITENEGELSVSVDDFDALAQTMYEITGIPIDADVWKSWMAALGAYSEEIDYTVDDLKNLAEAVGAVDEAGKINLSEIVTGQLEAGESADRVWDLVDALLDANANGEVELETDSKSVEEARKKVKTLIDEYLKTHGKDGDVEAHTDEAQKDVDNLTVSVEELTDGTWVVKINADTSAADAAISALQSSLQTIATAFGNVANVRGSFKAVEVPGNMATMASGGESVSGGMTLVNEFGPEIIKEGASARIAGSGKPTVTWLQPGALVYDAGETAQMLHGEDPSALFDGVGAYGGRASGIRRYTGSTASSSSSSSESSSGGSSSGGGGGSSSSASSTRATSSAASSSSASSDKDPQLEALKEVVELRKSELSLIEARKLSVDEQIAADVKIADAIGEQIQYMAKVGASQTEINNLSVQWYKVWDDVRALQEQVAEEEKKAAEEALEKHHKILEDTLNLRESELKILQAEGAPLDDQIAKQEEIVKAIQLQIDSMTQEHQSIIDINNKRVELIEAQNTVEEMRQQKIDQEVQKLEEIVTLNESILSKLQAEDASYLEQYTALQDIASAMMNQIMYMESVGASQTEINGLYVEWYNIMAQITSLQNQLYGNFQTAIGTHIQDLNKQRQEEIAQIDAQIKGAQAANSARQQHLQTEQKILAVQKAEAALQNAMSDRSVRYYNAVTGQWEWGANAKNVKSAEDALESARDALREASATASFNAGIAALEAQKEEINAKYDEEIAKWQELSDSLDPPMETIAEALQDLVDNQMPETDEKLDGVISALQDLGVMVDKYAKTVTDTEGNALTYDSGGVLTGLGGIKATTGNEMVLPPDITKRMLEPTATGAFNQRMSELRYLYGNGTSMRGRTTNNTIGSQHNGDTYTYGNITLTKQQAETTTVAQLARLAGNLRLYSSGA